MINDPFLNFTTPEAPTPLPAPPAAKQPAKPTFSTRLRAVQDAGEDFEWYPTTDEIIAGFRLTSSALALMAPPAEVADVA